MDAAVAFTLAHRNQAVKYLSKVDKAKARDAEASRLQRIATAIKARHAKEMEENATQMAAAKPKTAPKMQATARVAATKHSGTNAAVASKVPKRKISRISITKPIAAKAKPKASATSSPSEANNKIIVVKKARSNKATAPTKKQQNLPLKMRVPSMPMGIALVTTAAERAAEVALSTRIDLTKTLPSNRKRGRSSGTVASEPDTITIVPGAAKKIKKKIRTETDMATPNTQGAGGASPTTARRRRTANRTQLSTTTTPSASDEDDDADKSVDVNDDYGTYHSDSLAHDSQTNWTDREAFPEMRNSLWGSGRGGAQTPDHVMHCKSCNKEWDESISQTPNPPRRTVHWLCRKCKGMSLVTKSIFIYAFADPTNTTSAHVRYLAKVR
jgi:hypothetical protein